jgi:predicted RecB family nuclease
MFISKSKYIRGWQCVKNLWLKCYRPELEEQDPGLEMVFKNGTMVGELARDLFPGGVLIQFTPDLFEMAARTKAAMDSGAEAVYEAAFVHGDLAVICDILVKSKDGYDIYEVKSTTDLKEVLCVDAAYQHYVLAEAGIRVNRAHVVHLNGDYVREGELDLGNLFCVRDVTDYAYEIRQEIETGIRMMRKALKSKKEPEQDIGLHCHSPYECGFWSYCTKHLPVPCVFDITGMRKRKQYRLYGEGCFAFEDLIDSHLTGIQLLQVEAELQGAEEINTEGILESIGGFSYPLYFLDFETYMQPVPPFDGLRPYEQIPFQYSVHSIEAEDGELQHREFLAKEGADPRRALAERLVRDVPAGVCVVAYNMTFEETVLRSLANRFPDLAPHLMSIHDNLQDLMAPFRKGYYYNRDMQGSYSLKYVLLALITDDPELDYAGLDVRNGSEAMDAFASLHEKTPEEIEAVRAALLAYCHLDTLAMVRIWEKLRDMAG